jgi:transcriptional antiterminator RfaH
LGWFIQTGFIGKAAMDWYLVHTKPRQEKTALQHLQQQGYECYLPLLPVEKIAQGAITVTPEPLFPRYLFIHLGCDQQTKSWSPIRSTRGVSRLVCFGQEPAKVQAGLIQQLRQYEALTQQAGAQALFTPGQRVRLLETPFAGLEGIYQMAEGERRVLVLIEILSKPVAVRVAPSALRKLG